MTTTSYLDDYDWEIVDTFNINVEKMRRAKEEWAAAQNMVCTCEYIKPCPACKAGYVYTWEEYRYINVIQPR